MCVRVCVCVCDMSVLLVIAVVFHLWCVSLGVKLFFLLRVELYFYVSKCSASIQIPHIETILTKHIEVAALGHKMRQFIN